MCDKYIPGANYCANPANNQCYIGGWPACCSQYAGVNCPMNKPPCNTRSGWDRNWEQQCRCRRNIYTSCIDEHHNVENKITSIADLAVRFSFSSFVTQEPTGLWDPSWRFRWGPLSQRILMRKLLQYGNAFPWTIANNETEFNSMSLINVLKNLNYIRFLFSSK